MNTLSVNGSRSGRVLQFGFEAQVQNTPTECDHGKFEKACNEGLIDKNRNFSPIEKTISQILNDLDIPNWKTENVLTKLAEIRNIKFYITTGFIDLFEHALEEKRGKGYSKEYDDPDAIYCNGEYITDESNKFYNPKDKEMNKTPFVYNFFGKDTNVDKMILTEDDHIKFLIDISQAKFDQNKNSSTSVPGYIKGALTESTLLFLGYRWQDWEFRKQRAKERARTILKEYRPNPLPEDIGKALDGLVSSALRDLGNRS